MWSPVLLFFLVTLTNLAISGIVKRDGHEHEEECCDIKTVGDYTYNLKGSDSQAKELYGCLSDCVYTKEGSTDDALICFKTGDLPVSCDDPEPTTSGSGITGRLAKWWQLCQPNCPVIAGYETQSDVTEHNELDLDQKNLEDSLDNRDFDKAEQIYSQGGSSMKTHTITLSVGLTMDYKEGDEISQGSAGVGMLHADASVGDTTLKVGITSACTAETLESSGCFTDGTSMSIKEDDVGNVENVQYVWRTIEKFSTQADDKMAGQKYFELYKAYYGSGDYADKFVKAAFAGADDGEFKFADKSEEYRAESAKIGSDFWAIWMYIIREMEDAVEDCVEGDLTENDAPVHAWDEAWAFYAGSLEGTEGDEAGVLLYREAENCCESFGTCTDGKSVVNRDLLALFDEGKATLKAGKCQELNIYAVVNLMTVPLIQATLLNAKQYNDGDASKAKAAAFLGALLPQLDACSSDDATTVKNLLWIDGSYEDTDYNTVVTALENNYGCMGVPSGQVGTPP